MYWFTFVIKDDIMYLTMSFNLMGGLMTVKNTQRDKEKGDTAPASKLERSRALAAKTRKDTDEFMAKYEYEQTLKTC